MRRVDVIDKSFGFTATYLLNLWCFHWYNDISLVVRLSFLKILCGIWLIINVECERSSINS